MRNKKYVAVKIETYSVEMTYSIHNSSLPHSFCPVTREKSFYHKLRQPVFQVSRNTPTDRIIKILYLMVISTQNKINYTLYQKNISFKAIHTSKRSIVYRQFMGEFSVVQSLRG
jgi:hypothetical protein